MDSKYYFNNTYAQVQTQPPSEIKDESLDKFISHRSSILNSKLEILLKEVQARLAVKHRNTISVDNDIEKVKDIMHELSPKAFYINNSTEKDEFHKLKHKSLELEKERRDQEVSCWNDVVPVMRDLLNTWEAHQQSSARAQLLKSKGLEKLIEDSYSDDECQEMN